MYFAVMHLAKGSFQVGVVIPISSVVLLNAQNARSNSDSQALPLLLSRLAPRRADWLPIFQAAPPLNVRYREKSDSAGSMTTIVRPAVTSSTPAIRFPCQGARASRLPRK
jgi:hypothetical protein